MKNKEKKILDDIIRYVKDNPEHDFDIRMEGGKMTLVWAAETIMDYLMKDINPDIYYNDYGMECLDVENGMTKVTGCLWFGVIYAVVVRREMVEKIDSKYLLEDYIWNN